MTVIHEDCPLKQAVAEANGIQVLHKRTEHMGIIVQIDELHKPGMQSVKSPAHYCHLCGKELK